MTGSFMERLRARAEKLQEELTPEAGFDRRAYGYDGDGEDATFEDVARDDESPWRRAPAEPAPPDPPEPGGSAGPVHTPETPEPRVTPVRASTGTRPAASDPFGVVRRGPGDGLRRDTPSPPPRDASAPLRTPAAPADGVRSTPYGLERRRTRGATRAEQIRARLRRPDSLRELFLLREVIDRPVALRRRPHYRPR